MGLPSKPRSVHSAASLPREAPSGAKRRAGFTLIEMIAVLLLTALALVFTAMLLVTSTEIFISTRNAAEDSQKVQVAMNRLVKELTWAQTGSVDTSVANTVSWASYHPDRLAAGTQTAALVGTELRLGGTPLLDNVGLFTVDVPEAGAFSITLQSSRSAGVTHTTVVHPRYEL